MLYYTSNYGKYVKQKKVTWIITAKLLLPFGSSFYYAMFVYVSYKFCELV